MQFKSNPPSDCIFQNLSCKAGVVNNISVNAGDVFFEWGMISGQLYFSYKTVGKYGRYKTFRTKDRIGNLTNTQIYRFVFTLFNGGDSGAFGYSTNNNLIVLETVEVANDR
jgi:hypothetical protein